MEKECEKIQIVVTTANKWQCGRKSKLLMTIMVQIDCFTNLRASLCSVREGRLASSSPY